MSRRVQEDHRLVDACRIRICVLGGFLLIGFAALLIALFLQQIRLNQESDDRILRQSIRRIRIPAMRGKIFTRDLMVLADNRLKRDLVFYPEEMRQRRRKRSIDHMLEAERKLAAAIGRPSGLTRAQLIRHLNNRPGLPLTVFEDLTPQEAARAAEVMRKLRGADLQLGSVRDYPRGTMASWLIGYTRSDDPRAADDRGEFFYYLPDQVGRSGIEKAFDTLPGDEDSGVLGLRGKPGYSLAQVDYLGYIHQNLIEKIEPIHGNNVVLTLDSRAQTIGEELLRGYRGALVAVDADNGDVLAAVSRPGYDLRRFVPRLSPEYYRALKADPEGPLRDRAFRGSYTPGSIVKPLSALAYLNCGVHPGEQVLCDGGVAIGNAVIRCAAYRRGGHGAVDMPHAIIWSCNCYVIEMALKEGFPPLAKVLDSAGFGRKTGVEVPESVGVFPSDDFKRKHYKSRWNRYDTGLLSMGQGIISVTPLQAALYCAALSNGGILWRPHVVDRVVDSSGTTLFQRTPETAGHLAASAASLALIRDAMQGVVESPTGSGRNGRVDGLIVCGKTGTAEVGAKNALRKNTWFIAHTQYKKRRVAVALIVEDGHSGGTTCAPVVAEFLRRWLLEGPQPGPVYL